MEYEDYQCPQCQRANELVKAIQQQLADQFCFVFRHFPLRAWSLQIAESAEAAAAQNKFWEMHELLLQNKQQIEDSHLVEYADNMALDVPQLLRKLADHIHLSRIQTDIDSGHT